MHIRIQAQAGFIGISPAASVIASGNGKWTNTRSTANRVEGNSNDAN